MSDKYIDPDDFKDAPRALRDYVKDLQDALTDANAETAILVAQLEGNGSAVSR